MPPQLQAQAVKQNNWGPKDNEPMRTWQCVTGRDRRKAPETGNGRTD
jgi:hypothetical protein